MFVAPLFVAAGIVQGVLEDAAGARAGSMSDTFELCRRISAALLHTYAMRMAAVFMISTSTIGLRTRFMAEWLAFSGFLIAVAVPDFGYRKGRPTGGPVCPIILAAFLVRRLFDFQRSLWKHPGANERRLCQSESNA